MQWHREIEQRLSDPSARVVCLDPTGAKTLPLHPDLARFADQMQPATGPLDLFEPSDRSDVIKAYALANIRGTASTEARLTSGETRRVDLFDEQETLDCFVVVIGPPTGAAIRFGDNAIELKVRSAVFTMDMSGAIQWAHSDIEGLFGWSPSELLGKSSLEFTHPDDQEQSIAAWISLLEQGPSARYRTRRRFLTKHEGWKWVESTSTNHLDDPERGAFSTEVIDLSDEMAALGEAKRRGALLTRLTEALPSGVLHIDTERLPIFWNRRWIELLSHGSPSIEGLLEQIQERHEVGAAIDRSLTAGVDADLDVTITSTGNEGQKYGRLHLRPLEHADGTAEVLITLEDTTTAREYQQGLHDLAHRDSLTGVLGRLGSRPIVEDLLASTAPSRALLFVDLDGFKMVNDTFGHATGDAVLRAVGNAITLAVRQRDAVARVGGDEFVVTVRGVTDPVQIVERIHAALLDAEQTIDHPVEIRASIGMARVEDGDTFDSLFRRADHAMYEVKRVKQNSVA